MSVVCINKSSPNLKQKKRTMMILIITVMIMMIEKEKGNSKGRNNKVSLCLHKGDFFIYFNIYTEKSMNSHV